MNPLDFFQRFIVPLVIGGMILFCIIINPIKTVDKRDEDE